MSTIIKNTGNITKEVFEEASKSLRVNQVDPVTGVSANIITDGAGVNRVAVDANFYAQNVQVSADLDSDEDAVAVEDPDTGAHIRVELDGSINTNTEIDATDGDNIGLKVQARNATPSDLQYSKRVTATTGSSDTTVTSLDVSLHDHSGNQFTETNQVPTNTSLRDGTNPNLKVTVNSDNELETDNDSLHSRNETFNKSSATGGELDDTSTILATEGNVSPVRITPYRAFHTNLRAEDGTEISSSSVHYNKRVLDVSVSNFGSSSGNLDGFGRLRISEPVSIFDSTFEYDKQPLLFSELLVSGASATYDTDKKSVILSTNTTLGSKVTYQSRRYFKYHPGKSNLIKLTGNFSEGVVGVRKRVGQFDDNNGYYFELSGATPSVNLRSKVSGTVVNSSVTQSSWNLDKLDGTGISGLSLNVSNQQIFFIDYQWLGSGRVRFGFSIDGINVYCHEFLNANNLDVPYSQTANLPLRWEVETTTGGASSSMFITCCAIISEGGYDPEGQLRTINNGSTAISFTTIGTTKPVLSVRKQSIFLNVPIKLLDFQVSAATLDDFLISLRLNGTLTAPSWTNVSGIAQKEVSATAITGGVELYSFYIRSGSGGSLSQIISVFENSVNSFLGSDLSGNSDILSIVATNLTLNASIMASINYKELT